MLLAAILPACSAPAPPAEAIEPVRVSFRNGLAAPSGQLPERWWEQFASSRLNALVERALRDSPGIAAVRERLIAARSVEEAGAAQFKPGLAFRTGSQPTPEASHNYFQASVDARWELPLFDRDLNSARMLASGVVDSEADVAAARCALIADVVRAYLDGHFASEQESRSGTLLQLATERQDRMAVRVRVGLEDQDAEAASKRVSREARAGLEEQRAIRAQSLEKLAALLGQNDPDETWFDPADSALQTPAEPASIPADLIRRRPDIRHAQAAMQRAAAQLGIARAEMYPHISIEGALTAALRFSSGVSGGVNSILAAGPVISLPLFDWGLRRAQSQARGAELRAASYSYRQVVLDAVAETERALVDLNRAKFNVLQLATAADSAQADAQRAAMQRRIGLLEQVVEVDVRRQSLLIDQDLENARREQAMATVRLYAALGAGTGVPDGVLDKW